MKIRIPIHPILSVLLLLIAAHTANAQVSIVQAYVSGLNGSRVATFPTGNQIVSTFFSVQGLPANSNWKLSFYQPGGSLYTTATGAYNNPAAPPNTVIVYSTAVPRVLALAKGDWHIQLAINGQQSADIYFSAGLGAPVLDHAIVISQDFLTAQTQFDVGVNLIGSTAWSTNFSAGSWIRLRYQRPDGTIAADNTWETQFPNSFNGFAGVRWFVNLDQVGTWHLIFDLNGQTLTTNDFQVVPATSVLLIHGNWSSAVVWNGVGGMLDTLQKNGYFVEAVDFPTEQETKSNETYIELQAQAIARRIQDLQGRSGKQLTNLVCHSMGGLAARYYLEHPELWRLKDQNGTSYSGVAKLIMLGTPNWGTDAALLDPVASITLAHVTTLPRTSDGYNSTATDTYSNWSPAVQEMFAEWQPAPLKNGNAYSYPVRFSVNLAKWPANPSYQSPIQSLSYGYDLWYLSIFSIYGSDFNAGIGVFNAFPVDPRARRSNHLAYYPQMAQQLGIEYPQITGGTDGVDTRLVSPFLYSLNVTDIGNFAQSGAKVYVVAGTLPIAIVNPTNSNRVIAGPFSSDPFNGGIANDGVVPTDSVFGRDPITGNYLFSHASQASFSTYHTDLPHNSAVISQVIAWLGE